MGLDRRAFVAGLAAAVADVVPVLADRRSQESADYASANKLLAEIMTVQETVARLSNLTKEERLVFIRAFSDAWQKSVDAQPAHDKSPLRALLHIDTLQSDIILRVSHSLSEPVDAKQLQIVGYVDYIHTEVTRRVRP